MSKFDIKSVLKALGDRVNQEPVKSKARALAVNGRKEIFSNARKVVLNKLARMDYSAARQIISDLEQFYPREPVDVKKELRDIVLWDEISRQFEDYSGHKHLYYVLGAKKLYPEQALLPLDIDGRIASARRGKETSFRSYDPVLREHSCLMELLVYMRTQSFESYVKCFVARSGLLVSDAHCIYSVDPIGYEKDPFLTSRDVDVICTVIDDIVGGIVMDLGRSPMDAESVKRGNSLLGIYCDAAILKDVRARLPQLPSSFWESIRGRVYAMNDDIDSEQLPLEVSILASLANSAKPEEIPDFFISRDSWEMAKIRLESSKITCCLGGPLMDACRLLNSKVYEDRDYSQKTN